MAMVAMVTGLWDIMVQIHPYCVSHQLFLTGHQKSEIKIFLTDSG